MSSAFVQIFKVWYAQKFQPFFAETDNNLKIVLYLSLSSKLLKSLAIKCMQPCDFSIYVWCVHFFVIDCKTGEI